MRALAVSACLLLVVAVTVAAAASAAAPACRPLTSVDPQALATFQFDDEPGSRFALPDGERYHVGEISIVRQDVFERPANWLHRQANRYHPKTRERVVRSVLPMRPGDAVDARLLAEAERILRSKVYLYDARVIPLRICGDELDVLVVIRDVWSLMPRLSVVRAGGENDIGIGISDLNVAGSGKSLLLGYDKGQDRRGVVLAASDPNIADSRWAANLVLVDNDDGGRVAFSVRRPFYSLKTRYAFRVDGDDFERDEGLYFLSNKLWEYRADTRFVRVAGSWSTGLRDRFVNRVSLGFARETYRFDLPAALLAAVAGTADPDRRFGYPYLAFERVEDDFDKRVNVDRVQRTEDLALGQRVYGELGYSSDAGGGDGEYLVGRASFADAAWLTDRQLLSFQSSLGGYYDLDDQRSENVFAQALLTYRWQHAESWSLLIRGAAAASRNTTLDQQLLLGGSTGLRGYPNRYQIGDRRILFTLEERYYSSIYPLQMFRLGTAAFVDVGRAWYEDDVPDWVPADRSADHFGTLGNVGIGLRLESTRTRRDLILHLDVSVPWRSGPEVRNVEVTLTAKQSL
ncbi:MAG: hypothetical protein RIC56_12585 [Pseudomonadales bacterium]